jgi:hypothetical protein
MQNDCQYINHNDIYPQPNNHSSANFFKKQGYNTINNMSNDAKQIIYDQTKTLVAKESFDGFNVRKLAEYTGLSPSHLYYYTKNTKILFKEVFDITAKELGAKRSKLDQTPTLSDMLKQRIEFQFDNATEVVYILKYFTTFHNQFPKNECGYIPKTGYKHILEVLEKMKEESQYNIDESDKLAKIITHTINGFVLEYYPNIPKGKRKRRNHQRHPLISHKITPQIKHKQHCYNKICMEEQPPKHQKDTEQPTQTETETKQTNTSLTGAYLGMLEKLRQMTENPTIKEAINKVDSIRKNYNDYVALTLLGIALAVGNIEPPTTQQSQEPILRRHPQEQTFPARETFNPREIRILPIQQEPQNQNTTRPPKLPPQPFAPQELTDPPIPIETNYNTESTREQIEEERIKILADKYQIPADIVKTVVQTNSIIREEYKQRGLNVLPDELMLALIRYENRGLDLSKMPPDGLNSDGSIDRGFLRINGIWAGPETKGDLITIEDMYNTPKAVEWAWKKLYRTRNETLRGSDFSKLPQKAGYYWTLLRYNGVVKDNPYPAAILVLMYFGTDSQELGDIPTDNLELLTFDDLGYTPPTQ